MHYKLTKISIYKLKQNKKKLTAFMKLKYIYKKNRSLKFYKICNIKNDNHFSFVLLLDNFSNSGPEIFYK